MPPVANGGEDNNIGPGQQADCEEVEQMLFAIDAELSLISAQSAAIKGDSMRSTNVEDDADDEGQDLPLERQSTEAQSESEEVDNPPHCTRQRSTDVEDDMHNMHGQWTDDEDELDELCKVDSNESKQG
ncbi:hypothetical protein F5051DRAFT_433733 [Lentinula edodes]|nr:hypothetical protein F5051DRAFT_433733 [Lentinula edodes]